MGEAKRKQAARLDATASGQPVPRPTRCPGCGGKRIGFHTISDTEYGTCGDCRAVWEAFPPLYVEDPVCAEPCDNCAFRPGSPEQADPKRWKEIIASLKPDPITGMFTGQFYCHKNVPMDLEAGAGNFRFPMKPASKEPPFDQAETYDLGRMRTCSGFLRMFWAQRDKLEKAGTLRPELADDGAAPGRADPAGLGVAGNG